MYPAHVFLLHSFWVTACKMVRPMLSDHCLSVSVGLSVCDVGVLWPNSWMDQGETWLAGRPRPSPHCVRWGPSSPSPKGAEPSQFLAHICCGQMARWINMPLGMEVGLGPGHIMLDGDPAPQRKANPQFSVIAPQRKANPPIFGAKVGLGT